MSQPHASHEPRTPAPTGPGRQGMTVAEAARLDASEVLVRLASQPTGLPAAEAAARQGEWGPNAVQTHRARPWGVVARQLRSPLLLLLVATATVPFFVGERSDAVIIGVILVLSVGLGFLTSTAPSSPRRRSTAHRQDRHTDRRQRGVPNCPRRQRRLER